VVPPQSMKSVDLTLRFLLFSCFLSLHPIQKNNTIRMIDELITYPIYLTSAFGIASFKTLMYAPFISTLSNTVSATLQASNRPGAAAICSLIPYYY